MLSKVAVFRGALLLSWALSLYACSGAVNSQSKAQNSDGINVTGDSQSLAAENSRLPLPENFELTASFDKEHYFLGENVLLQFRLKNTGAKGFKIETGGDYRGSPRSLRFIVKAYDQSGKEMPDPFPGAYCEGGLGGVTYLKPGDSFTTSLPLMRYRRFEQAGKYKISVSHDFGWDKKSGPEVLCNLDLRMPSPSEAAAIVEKMSSLSPNPYRLEGHRSAEFQDFSTLAYPVYLPILLEMAGKDESKVFKKNDLGEISIPSLEGIAAIASPEATKALIRFCRSKNQTMALIALKSLNMRLPDPVWDEKLPARSVFENPMNAERKRFVSLSWKPEFSGELRSIAAQFLKKGDRDDQVPAAYVFECIGTKDDAPLLIEALNQAVSQIKDLKPELNYPRPRGSAEELIRAALMIVQRGYLPDPKPQSKADAAFFILAVATNKNYRPLGWQDVYKALLSDSSPYIKELAANHLPAGLDIAMSKSISPMLRDTNPDLQISALRLLQKTPDPALKDDVLQIVRSAKDFMLFQEALNTCSALKCEFESQQIIAGRLGDDPKIAPELDMQYLHNLVSYCLELPNMTGMSGGSSPEPEQRAALKANWLRLLNAKEAQLKAGKKIAMSDPLVSSALLPKDYQINFADGHVWPPQHESAGTLLNKAQSLIGSAESLIVQEPDDCLTKLNEAFRILQRCAALEDFNGTIKAGRFGKNGYEPDALQKIPDYANQLFVQATVCLADLKMQKADFSAAEIAYAESILRRVRSSRRFEPIAKMPGTSEILSAYKQLLDREEKDYLGEAQIATRDLIALARAFDLQKKFSEAEPIYEAAIPHLKSIDFRHMSADSENTPIVEAAFKAPLNLALKTLPANDSLIASRFESLARFYQYSGDENKAGDSYQKAIAIRELHPEKATAMLCFDLSNLKELLADNNPAEQEKLTKKLLAAQEKVSGIDNPESLKILYNESLPAAENRGDKEQAMKILNRIFAWREKVGQDKYPELPKSIYLFYRMLDSYKNSSWSKAGVEAMLAKYKALRLRFPVTCDDAHYSVDAVKDISQGLAAFGDKIAAEELLKDELSRCPKSCSTALYVQFTINDALGDLYLQESKYPQALQVFRRNLELAEKNPGHSDLDLALTRMARAYTASSQPAQAEAFLLRRLALEEKADKNGAPDWSYDEIADCYFAQGKKQKALEFRKKAKSARTSINR
ncbi:MAG: tetratricopeptide repeat protein [Candidatus Obscuribacterales bacterium]|nr:tetratricopeptide repeat protein [Candidatus Obscuribacterales bacterium]